MITILSGAITSYLFFAVFYNNSVENAMKVLLQVQQQMLQNQVQIALQLSAIAKCLSEQQTLKSTARSFSGEQKA